MTGATTSIPFIDLMAQQSRIREAVDIAIARVLDHGKYIMGPEVLELEQQLASFCDVAEVVSCSSGTDALWLPLLAWEIGPGDAVFLPSFTFTATAEAVALCGATCVFVDVDPVTFNMSPQSLARAIDRVEADGDLTPRAVIPVDLFGIPAPYGEIEALAAPRGIKVLADAAQSFGAESGNKRVGALAEVTGTSFFPAKPLGCYGDGGAIFTNDPDFAEVLRSIRVHGRGSAGKYDNVRIGTNARLDTIQAAVLLEKLAIFPGELAARQKVAERYDAALRDCVTTPAVPRDQRSAWAQYTLLANRRDDLAAALKNQGIPTQVYYPKPLHQQGPYLDCPADPDGLPVTEDLAGRVLSLPMHPYLEPGTQDRIIAAVLAATEAEAGS